MKPSHIRAALALAALAIGLAQQGAASPAGETPSKEFAARLDKYQTIRKQAIEGLPHLRDKATPDQIVERTRTLQIRIRSLRADAKPGDVLTPAIYELVATIRSETAGARGKPARETVLGEGNPAEEGIHVPLKVNAPYPAQAPLSTVPPDLLARLPKLPDGLEYRFTGKNLILYDAEADMVVDFLAGAVTGPEASRK